MLKSFLASAQGNSRCTNTKSLPLRSTFALLGQLSNVDCSNNFATLRGRADDLRHELKQGGGGCTAQYGRTGAGSESRRLLCEQKFRESVAQGHVLRLGADIAIVPADPTAAWGNNTATRFGRLACQRDPFALEADDVSFLLEQQRYYAVVVLSEDSISDCSCCEGRRERGYCVHCHAANGLQEATFLPRVEPSRSKEQIERKLIEGARPHHGATLHPLRIAQASWDVLKEAKIRLGVLNLMHFSLTPTTEILAVTIPRRLGALAGSLSSGGLHPDVDTLAKQATAEESLAGLYLSKALEGLGKEDIVAMHATENRLPGCVWLLKDGPGAKRSGEKPPAWEDAKRLRQDRSGKRPVAGGARAA